AARPRAGEPEQAALGQSLRTGGPAGAVDAFPRPVVVAMGPSPRDRGAHLPELLEQQALLVFIVLDLERRVPVADDPVRRRVPVLLFEEDAVRDDLKDVREQRAPRDAAGLELDGNVMLAVRYHRVRSAGEAVDLRAGE